MLGVDLVLLKIQEPRKSLAAGSFDSKMMHRSINQSVSNSGLLT
jgi:hypothetical protein